MPSVLDPPTSAANHPCATIAHNHGCDAAVIHSFGFSLSYPKPGFRLFKQSDIENVNAQMAALQEKLDEAVRVLDDHFGRTE